MSKKIGEDGAEEGFFLRGRELARALDRGEPIPGAQLQFAADFASEEDAKAALGDDLMGGALEPIKTGGVRVVFTSTPEKRREIEQRVCDWGYAEVAARRRPWETRN